MPPRVVTRFRAGVGGPYNWSGRLDDGLERMSGQGTTTISLRVDDDGVVHIVGLPDSTQTIDEARANVRAVARLTGARRRPLLVDMRAVKYLDRGARDYYAGDEAMALATALAVLVDSSLTRLLANMVLATTRTTVPTKTFTGLPEALTWLRRSG